MTTIPHTEPRGLRPLPDEFAPYYQTYVGRVGDGDIVATLGRQLEETLALLRSIDEERAGFRYAEGKWSIREVVAHLTDAERVFGYRAMRFARADQTPLPGFDENAYVANGSADRRSLATNAAEFEAVRRATIAFFDSLEPDEWMRTGTANGVRMSVRSFAWIVAGHELHHVGLLRERYLRG